MSFHNLQQERGDCDSGYSIGDHLQQPAVQQPENVEANSNYNTEDGDARAEPTTLALVDTVEQSIQHSQYERQMTTSSLSGHVSAQNSTQDRATSIQHSTNPRSRPVYEGSSQRDDQTEHVASNAARQPYEISDVGATSSRSSHSSPSLFVPPRHRRHSQSQAARYGRLHTEHRATQVQPTTAREEQSQSYANFDHRLQSFDGWPIGHHMDINYLALAGFYYTGTRDSCRCFFCGATLHSWEPGDDPFIEHARWYPNCPHVKLIKGEAFVQAVEQVAQQGGRVTKEQVEMLMRRHNSMQNVTQIEHQIPVRASDELAAHGCCSVPEENIQLGNREHNPCPESLFCKICLVARVRVLTLPCNHVVICFICAQRCQQCPVCSCNILKKLRAHLR